MNKKYKMVGVFSAFVILTGCASFTSPARKHELDVSKPYWFDYDATRRGAILFPSSASVTVCSEPSPDVALDIVNKLKLEAEAEKIQTKGKVESDISEQVVQLAKRTQTIMFLRESLYRLCELSGNRKLTNDEVIAQYSKVIDAARSLAEAELENSKQGAAEAEAHLLNVQKSTASAIDDATKKGGE
jgi:hypothetical protein